MVPKFIEHALLNASWWSSMRIAKLNDQCRGYCALSLHNLIKSRPSCLARMLRAENEIHDRSIRYNKPGKCAIAPSSKAMVCTAQQNLVERSAFTQLDDESMDLILLQFYSIYTRRDFRAISCSMTPIYYALSDQERMRHTFKASGYVVN